MNAGWKRLASFFLFIKERNRLTNVLPLQAPCLAWLASDARNIQREGKKPPQKNQNNKGKRVAWTKKKTQFACKNFFELKCFTLGQLNVIFHILPWALLGFRIQSWEEVSQASTFAIPYYSLIYIH